MVVHFSFRHSLVCPQWYKCSTCRSVPLDCTLLGVAQYLVAQELVGLLVESYNVQLVRVAQAASSYDEPGVIIYVAASFCVPILACRECRDAPRWPFEAVG